MEIFRAENRKDPYGSIYRSIRTAYAAGRASLQANVPADVAALIAEVEACIHGAVEERFAPLRKTLRQAAAALQSEAQHAEWYRYLRAGYCKSEGITEELFDKIAADAIGDGRIP